MNFFNRVQGIFFNPQQVFKFLAEKPVWVDALVLILVVVLAFSYLVTPFSQQDQAKMLENNIKLRERLGEDRFEEMLDNAKNPTQIQTIFQTVIAPIAIFIGMLISSLFIMFLGRMISSEGKYIQILAAFIHANLIDKVLGNALRLFLILSKKSVLNASTSLAIFFPKLEMTTLPYMILSQFDFFQLWMFGILGFGLAYIFKVELKKALIISFLFWAIKSILYIGMFIIGTKLAGG